jgi:Rod binding domain-containing protein
MNSITSPMPVSPSISPDLATPAVASGRGAKAAHEFEAQLIGSLLESMEKTFAALPGEDSVTGADNYNYLATHTLAEALAARGGFGIAAMIAPHLTETRPVARK